MQIRKRIDNECIDYKVACGSVSCPCWQRRRGRERGGGVGERGVVKSREVQVYSLRLRSLKVTNGQKQLTVLTLCNLWFSVHFGEVQDYSLRLRSLKVTNGQKQLTVLTLCYLSFSAHFGEVRVYSLRSLKVTNGQKQLTVLTL